MTVPKSTQTAPSRSAATRKRTRIQREKEELILEAALDVFSQHGFRGSTIDQIAVQAGLSKPNVLYYFRTKEAIHRRLIDRLLDNWLEPLRGIREDGDPLSEIQSYIRRKLELARDFPRESRLFANEILQGAPHIQEELYDLRELVESKSLIINGWIKAGTSLQPLQIRLPYLLMKRSTAIQRSSLALEAACALKGAYSGRHRLTEPPCGRLLQT